MLSKITSAILLVLVIIICSCTSALYIPLQSDVCDSTYNIKDLQVGREIYINSCGDCHNLYLPEKRSVEKWNLIFPKMQKKAKLNDYDMGLIKIYILSRAIN